MLLLFLGTAVTKGRPAGKAGSRIFEYKKAVPWGDVVESEMLVEETGYENVKVSTKTQETAAQKT